MFQFAPTKGLSLLLLFLFSFAALAQPETSDLKNLRLKGKVASVKEITCRAAQLENGNIVCKWKIPELRKTCFNKKGNIINYLKYNEFGYIKYKEEYTYDTLGRKNSILINSSDDSLRIVHSFIYKNENSQVTENIIEDSVLLNSTQYFFTSDGKILREIVKDTEISQIYTYEYFYLGDSIQKFFKTETTEPVLLKVEKLNSAGLPVMQITYNPDGTTKSKILKYNKNMDVISETFIEEYTTTEYKYKYDRKNNWIEKIEFQNSKPELIIKRKIRYRL